jgi:hypothetical protein
VSGLVPIVDAQLHDGDSMSESEESIGEPVGPEESLMVDADEESSPEVLKEYDQRIKSKGFDQRFEPWEFNSLGVRHSGIPSMEKCRLRLSLHRPTY